MKKTIGQLIGSGVAKIRTDADPRGGVNPEIGKQIVIAGGCPRSGTTALSRMINSHPACAMSGERYSKIYSKGRIAPRYFTAAAFDGSLKDDLIDLAKPQPDFINAAFADPGVKIVGDKYPQIYEVYDQLFNRLEGVKLVYIFRNPLSVIESYQARADGNNPNANWSPQRGYGAGISEWNASVRTTLAAKERYGDRIGVFTYERVLYEKAAADILFETFLGVDPLPEKMWRRILRPDLDKTTTDKEMLRFAFLNADTDAYRALTEMALDKDVQITP